MIKEIGGYFGLDQFVNNEYYKGLLALNTGRNALLYLMKAKNIRKIFIPYYLCDSVSNMLERHKYDFEYYYISADFHPIFDQILSENDYLYIVNYYGQLSNDRVIFLKKKYKNVILDNTHAFFQRPIEGIDTIYSCRKYFGVPDGAYLSTNSVLDEKLETDISKGRMEHILGRFEMTASEYYSSFKESDASLKFEPLKYMSKLTKNILGAIDYEKVKRIRDANYAYLDGELKKTNKLQLIAPEGAFAYPFYLENGVKIRKELAEKKIYIPTLWPNVLDDTPGDSLEYDYAANILPLPCDQRYGSGKMKHMLGEIFKCIG